MGNPSPPRASRASSSGVGVADARERDSQPASGLSGLKSGVMAPGFFGVARKEPQRVAVATGKVLDEATTKKTKPEPYFLGRTGH